MCALSITCARLVVHTVVYTNIPAYTFCCENKIDQNRFPEFNPVQV